MRITPVRQEQLQERLGASFRELDVPLRVDWDDGRREAVLFAIEEESDRSRFSPRRLAHYCLDAAETFDTDRVVPVAIFLRAAPAGPSVLRLGTERRAYLTLDYLSVGLADLPAEEWMESDNLVARVNLPNMRFPPGARVEVYAQAVRGLLELEPDAERRAKYIDYIDIYAALDDNERERYRRRHAEESDIMAGIVQRARDEGRQEGLEQGLRQGMEQGLERGMEQGMRQQSRTMLARQLERRFGNLPAETGERLRRASGERPRIVGGQGARRRLARGRVQLALTGAFGPIPDAGRRKPMPAACACRSVGTSKLPAAACRVNFRSKGPRRGQAGRAQGLGHRPDHARATARAPIRQLRRRPASGCGGRPGPPSWADKVLSEDVFNSADRRV